MLIVVPGIYVHREYSHLLYRLNKNNQIEGSDYIPSLTFFLCSEHWAPAGPLQELRYHYKQILRKLRLFCFDLFAKFQHNKSSS